MRTMPMRFQMTLQVLVMLLAHVDAIPTLALRTVTQTTVHAALDCPTCTCTSPTVWPFSGCDVSCGAKCGHECCCIAGVGACPPAPPPTPPPTPPRPTPKPACLGSGTSCAGSTGGWNPSTCIGDYCCCGDESTPAGLFCLSEGDCKAGIFLSNSTANTSSSKNATWAATVHHY